MIQLTPQALDLQHQAADLHAAGCGTGAAAHIHQQHQNTPAEGGPQGEVLGGVAGGAHDGGSLKRRVGDGFVPALSQLHVQVDADQGDGGRQNQQIPPQLLAAQSVLDPASYNGVQQRKIDARQKRKGDDDPCDSVGLILGDRGVADGKAAGGDGGEGVVHRVEPGHARNAQGHCLRRRQHDIDSVQNLGGAAHTGHQLGLDGAGAFRFHQIVGAVAQMGRQRQKQHQNAHTAHPLGLAAPEQDAGRHGLHRVQNGGTGGGQTGSGLE